MNFRFKVKISTETEASNADATPSDTIQQDSVSDVLEKTVNVEIPVEQIEVREVVTK